MSLPTPNLDDRRFQDIVDEAKRRIPTYCPEWTSHNLSDPGIAIVELFAWMTEMILYRLNQVPDRLYTKFLDLVGIELYPPRAATTDLTFWLSAPDAEPVRIPAGTQVATAADEDQVVVFMTDRDLRIAQPRLNAFLTSSGGDRYTDCWDELRYPGVSVPCFTSVPASPGDSFFVGFRGSLAGNVVRLDVEASVEGLGIDPEHPPLAWHVWGGENWVPVEVYADETGGLNRHGSITLFIPPIHVPLTLAQKRAYWLRGQFVEVTGGRAYVASPEIASLRAVTLGGSVRAHHGEPVATEQLGRSDGTPGQAFQCRHAPVLPRRRGETVRTITEEGVTEWKEVEDFARSKAHHHHFVWDSATGEIRFGPEVRSADGSTRQHGAVPPKGADVVLAGYRTGGGGRGNVGANRLTTLLTTIPFIDRVTNLHAAAGGVDAETVDNAKLRAPITLRTGDRAVTAADIEQLALDAASGVARARCLPPTSPGRAVQLLVVPRVDVPRHQLTIDDFALDDELYAAIRAHLEPRRVLGTTIEVGAPYYQGVTVAALLTAAPGSPADLVRERALDVLYRFVNPLEGGGDGRGWPFDTHLNAGSVVQVLSAVDGVERVEETLLFEVDLRNEVRLGKGRESIRLTPESLFLSFQHRVVVR